MNAAALHLVSNIGEHAHKIAKRLSVHQRKALCELDEILAEKDDLEARKGLNLPFAQTRKDPEKIWHRLCELELILITRYGGEYNWVPEKKLWAFHSGNSHQHIHITRLGKAVAEQIRARGLPMGIQDEKGIPL